MAINLNKGGKDDGRETRDRERVVVVLHGGGKMVTKVRPRVRLSLRAAKFLSLVGPVGLIVCLILGAMFLDADGRVQRVFHVLRLAFAFILLAVFLDGHAQATTLSEKHDPLFDERERADRNRAFRASHTLIMSGIVASCLYANFALGWGWWLPNVRGAIDIVTGSGLVGLGLPGLILIWRERPEID